MKKKPPKNKNKFDEERARNILEFVFPEKYKDTVLQESPDIYAPDLCIGIEVTCSIKKNIQEKFAWTTEISGMTEKELLERNVKHIRNGDIEVNKLPNGQLSAGFCCWGSEHDIKSAYIKKLSKLNSHHFKHYKENNLFIFSWMIDKSEVEREASEIFRLNQQDNRCYQYKFEHLYIYREGLLYCLTLENANIEEFTVPKDVMDQISHTSFKKVFGISRDEYYKNSETY
ncbi:MAG: hypothetical protein Q8876_02865 [Bacillota bacterium]|nr:hypothetical protein [Bacillota bacterium]